MADGKDEMSLLLLLLLLSSSSLSLFPFTFFSIKEHEDMKMIHLPCVKSVH